MFKKFLSVILSGTIILTGLCGSVQTVKADSVNAGRKKIVNNTIDMHMSEDNGYLIIDGKEAPVSKTGVSGSGKLKMLKASYTDPAYSSIEDQMAKYPGTRDQNPYGTCWAHSSIALAEYDLIKSGKVSKAVDFSELQLAYFAINSVTDPLGGTAGDYNYADVPQGFNLFDFGANYYFSMKAFAGGIGPVDEAAAAYRYAAVYGTSGMNPALAYDHREAELENAYIINILEQPNEVKRAIEKYGAVGISYSSQSAWGGVNTYNWRDKDCTTFYTGDYTDPDHAVAVVGWDDEFPKEAFSSIDGYSPEVDGAWLIRNSWTADTGSSLYSYFWLSYAEPSIAADAFVYDFDTVPASRRIYQYDGGNITSPILYTDDTCVEKAATIFTAEEVLGTEYLEAISMTITEYSDAPYTVNVYENPSQGNPESGKLVATQSGKTSFAGVSTIAFTKPVALTAGNDYSAVVSLSGAGVDFEVSYFGDLYRSEVSPSGNTYYFEDGRWYDSISLYDETEEVIDGYVVSGFADACIKALTYVKSPFEPEEPEVPEEPVVVLPESITLNATSLSLSKGGTAVLSAEADPVDAEYTLSWESSDTSVAKVSKDGTVTAVAPGIATITATTSNGVKASCKVTVKLATPTAKAVSSSKSSVTVSWNKIAGAEGYYIYRSTSETSGFSKVKTITSGSTLSYKNTGLTTGKKYYYKVYAYKGSLKSSASKTVSATPVLAKPAIASSLDCTSTSITLKWNKVADATGYEIYRRSTSSGTWKKIKTVTSGSTVSYTDKSATATSYYRIRAVGKNGSKTIYSSYSPQIVSKKLGKTTAKLAAKVSGDKNINRIKWASVKGATGYVIYYKTSSKGSWTKITTTKSLSYAHTKIPKGKTYYYAVKPYYKNGTTTTYGALGTSCKGRVW